MQIITATFFVPRPLAVGWHVMAINFCGARQVSEQRVQWCETEDEAKAACERLRNGAAGNVEAA